jgi:methylmalonyl-CoA mutase cobalamin-binding subunit
MAEGDVKHQLAVSQLMASGMSAGDMLHDIVPAVARQLGDKWLLDEVSFVDVAVGSARLQSLFHGRDDLPGSVWAGSSAPSGEAVLMVVPEFEQHTLGAFVAADEMRHAGLWVRIGLLLTAEETCELLQANHFSMLGISIGSRDSVDRTADFVNYIRTYSEKVPPVVVSGNVVERLDIVRSKTGADFVVSTVQEAIESCGLEVTGEQALLEADAE